MVRQFYRGNGKFVIYKAPNGKTQLDVTVRGDTIWHTQRQIAELYDNESASYFKVFKNIFESGESERSATISKMGTVVYHIFRGASVEVVDHYKYFISELNRR